MKTKTLICFLFLSFLFLFIHPKTKNIVKEIHHLPELISSFRAKEYCSCHFIMKQKEKFCLGLVEKGYPFNRNEINGEIVTSTFVFKKAKAQYLGEKSGCVLL